MTRRACCVILAAILAPEQVQTVVAGNSAFASPVSLYFALAVEPTSSKAGTGTTSNADRVRILRVFLQDAGVLSLTEGVMSIIDILACVHGRFAR